MGIIGGFWNPDQNSLQIVQSAAPSNPTQGQQWFDTDTNQVLWWDGTRWLPYNTHYGCLVHSNVNITTINNSPDVIQFNQQVWDYGNMFTLGGGGVSTDITIPATGIYDYGISVAWINNSNATGFRRLQPNVNGVIMAVDDLPGLANFTGDAHQTFSATREFNSGAVLQFGYNQTSGVSMAIRGGVAYSIVAWCTWKMPYY